ncbi:MAG: hypothetical protein JKY56_11650, partial [Kofleriaceae bacterium]|nr:hypothetical protein [Kofleriaceae bacterium]
MGKFQITRLYFCFVCLLGLLGTACLDTESIECESGAVCPVGSRCAAEAPVCIFDDCGDKVVDDGEVCDDGNITSGDGCSADCSSLEECGDLTLDETLGEVCDDGKHCQDGTQCVEPSTCAGIGDGLCIPRDDGDCAADCASENVCGNLVINVNETCDDGDEINGDGCDNNCTITACGNGIETNAEACDDGRDCSDGTSCTDAAECVGIGDELCVPRSGDGCDADCSVTGCGNGVTAGDEACDDGRHCSNGTVCIDDGECAGIGDTICVPRSGDGCSADCSATEVCGDGQPDFGEACDNGSHCDDALPGVAGTPCVQGAGSCTGIGDELCIPRSDDGCSADCSSSEGCGNLLRDVDEQCDDGFDGDEDGAISLGNSCTNLCRFNICGDGIANVGVEECDSGIGSAITCDADCTVVE